MKAVVHSRYGSADGLTLQEVELPNLGDDQVRVRVQAASMTADIWHVV